MLLRRRWKARRGQIGDPGLTPPLTFPCPACCGGGGGPPCCNRCTAMRAWALTVGGVSGSGPCECSKFGGSFILRWAHAPEPAVPTDCVWSDWRTDHVSTDPCCWLLSNCWPYWTWHLQYVHSTQMWQVFANHINTPLYLLADAQWNCNGPNTLRLASPGGGGCGWPSSVMVQPNDSRGVDPCACQAFDAISANGYRFGVAGVGGQAGCETFNNFPFPMTAAQCQVPLQSPRCRWCTPVGGIGHASLTLQAAAGVAILEFVAFSQLQARYECPLLNFNPLGGSTFTKMTYACPPIFCAGSESPCGPWPATATTMAA